jgi:type IV secretion system protein VirB2
MENALKSKSGQTNQALLLSAAVVAVSAVVLFAPDVMATGGGANAMPWESTLTKILDSLQGPVARFAGIAAIVVTGLMFALGEGGGWFKRGLGIAFGLSLAFSATSFIDQLGFSGGAVI